MKRRIHIKRRAFQLMMAATMIFFISCEDWLELVPADGLVQDEYWKYKEDVEATLMGAYHAFSLLDQKLFLYGELRGDMLAENVNINQSYRSIMEGNLFPDNFLCDWQQFYLVINYCNFVLTYAPEVYKIDPTLTEFQLKAFEAEAIYLRSLAYFYLVRIFNEVPLVLEPSSNDNVDFYLSKSSEEVVLNHIVNDLEQHLSFVRDEYGSQEANKGRATKGAFLALMADIALWNFEYEACIAYIDQLEQYSFTLLPSGKWFDNFYPGNSLEGIFEFQFDDKLGQLNGTWGITYYFNQFLASEKAFDLLSPELSQEVTRGNGSLVSFNGKIWKFAGQAMDGRTLRSASEQRSCNWIVYRYADILLMKAEALSQMGQYEMARDILNLEIRKRARMNPVDLVNTAESFEDAILEERAKELAFEGKRWFDLLRMGRRNDYARKDELVQIIIANVPSTQKLVLASKLTNPQGWYFPIFDEEIERNNALEQNPYYAEFTTDD